MASTIPICTACGKAAGTFTCRGCVSDFCAQHVIEHRQLLSKQMDEIVVCRDQLYHSLDENSTDNRCKILTQQVDEWEKQSIIKIQQIANDTRQQVLNTIGRYAAQLADLTQELNQACHDDNFDERDLKKWTQRLDKLSNDLNTSSTINLREDYKPLQDVKSIFVSETATDSLGQAVGNIEIDLEKQVITHGFIPSPGSVRGTNDYSNGYHQIYFKIESIDLEKYIFIGIISKCSPTKPQSYKVSSAYGWIGVSGIVLNGVENHNYENYKSDVEKGDVLELLLACERQAIVLINQRTGYTHEIKIDITKCPFPWQLNLCLLRWHTSIRLYKP